MKIASVAGVKAKFSEYVRASSRSPVVITRNGKAVAAIVPLADEDDLERLMLGYSPKLRALLSAARKRLSAGAGVPHDEFWESVEGRRATRRGA
jgi:prevent-host-death family protein